MLDKALQAGAVALKQGLAYICSLKYPRVSKRDAEETFNDRFRSNHFPPWDKQFKMLDEKMQNYMMHYILRLANRRGLTYQFHTGLHAGNGNHIGNSNPELLTNLFLDYPDVTFDVFHIGYPYQMTVSALAKMFTKRWFIG